MYITKHHFVTEDEDHGYFGQEQVPLTDEIREILEEYPDGQIFKVCKEKPLRNDSVLWDVENMCDMRRVLNVFTWWSS